MWYIWHCRHHCRTSLVDFFVVFCIDYHEHYRIYQRLIKLKSIVQLAS
uniref:Uncharacterized protein n=1 Tax=Rhizophora mucronata TaxID=61149 RepID=A0A2P2NPN4_RHIMU